MSFHGRLHLNTITVRVVCRKQSGTEAAGPKVCAGGTRPATATAGAGWGGSHRLSSQQHSLALAIVSSSRETVLSERGRRCAQSAHDNNTAHGPAHNGVTDRSSQHHRLSGFEQTKLRLWWFHAAWW